MEPKKVSDEKHGDEGQNHHEEGHEKERLKRDRSEEHHELSCKI